MLQTIKNLLHKLNSDSLSHYYQLRLDSAVSTIEREAILYTQSLISLYDWNPTHDEETK